MEADTVLLERAGELARLDAALERTAAGAGGVLLVEGAAGIGKSALLAAAGSRAAARGIRVLPARATELEREFAFGALRQLLGSFVRSQPDVLAAAPAAAQALGVGDHAPAPPGFGTFEALYALLADLSDSEPLLLALDDAHWADPDSLRFLAFLAPRIDELPVLLLVAARPEEWDGRALLGTTASDPGTRSLAPAALTPAAARELVELRYGARAVHPDFARACHVATAGNPFFLRALLDELIGDGVEPTQDQAARVTELNPRAVSYAIVARLTRLSPAAEAVARSLAILGDGARLDQVARLAEIDPGAAAAGVDELVRSSILAPGSAPLAFGHPITRNAVDGDIARGDRRRLHLRALRMLEEQDAPAERLATHLVAVEAGSHPGAAAVLRSAAAQALARGASGSAAAYLRRALEDPGTDGNRGAMLFELGSAEMLIDGSAALGHLGEALALSEAPARRTAIAATIGRGLIFAGRVHEAVAVAERAVKELAVEDAAMRRRLQSIVFAASRMEPTLNEECERIADSVRSGIDGDDLAARAMIAGLALVDARAGRLSAAETIALGERALAGDVLLMQDNGGADFIGALIPLTLADSPIVLPTLETALRVARGRGDAFAVAANLIFSSQAHLVRGELSDAIADGAAGVAASAAYGLAIGRPWGCGYLAAAQVEAGDLDGARATLERAASAPGPPENAHWHPFVDARTRLLMAAGDARGALAAALDSGRRFAAIGGRNPAFIPWRSRAALCLVGLGEDRDRAAALAAEEVELARAWGAPRALGAALRAQGIVSGRDDGIALLHEAVAVLDGSPARLEHARALVDLGAATRRAGSRADARRHLDSGLALARSCGATPLAQRAYEELLATGARPRKVVYIGVDALTPSERRVATLAAGGMTNREIAQHLFVTVKTVEFHLGQAYRKLDISSRGELSRALG